MTAPKRKLELQFNPLAVRLSEEDLESMAELKVGGIEGGRRRQRESDDEDKEKSNFSLRRKELLHSLNREPAEETAILIRVL